MKIKAIAKKITKNDKRIKKSIKKLIKIKRIKK